jgi:hypothetical protein
VPGFMDELDTAHKTISALNLSASQLLMCSTASRSFIIVLGYSS